MGLVVASASAGAAGGRPAVDQAVLCLAPVDEAGPTAMPTGVRRRRYRPFAGHAVAPPNEGARTHYFAEEIAFGLPLSRTPII